MMATSKKILEQEPSEVEMLLPWHAAGTLNARDARRVDEALARDPGLAKQYAAIQEEYAETIHLNESLGAPSVRAMQKLFAAIDGEPARKPSVSFDISARIAGLVRFAPDARVADIMALLDNYQASIVDGAKGGLFRLQFANRAMGRDEFAGLMRKLQNEKIVSLAVDAQ